MKIVITNKTRRTDRSGFTLVEVMVAASISVILFAALMTTFVWTVRVTDRSDHFAVAQHEASRSVKMVTHYVRNASAIDAIDVSGNWVRVRMPDGKVSRFAYVSDPAGSGLGKLSFVNDISNPQAGTNIVARGMTKVMTLPVRNVFEKTAENTLRVAYRISNPNRDGDCAAEVDTGIRLRNY